MAFFKCEYNNVKILLSRAGSITNTAKSLDILRVNLQKFINKEIDGIVQKYMDVSCSGSSRDSIGLKMISVCSMDPNKGFFSLCKIASRPTLPQRTNPKLGRNIGDSTEKNLRALVSMATIPLPWYSIKNGPVSLILGLW